MNQKILTVLAICCVFAGCQSGGDSYKITATVENGNDYNSEINTVKAYVIYGHGDEYEIATGKYSGGGFRLTLPQSVSSNYLGSAADIMRFFMWSDAVQFSDPQVGLATLEVAGYEGDDMNIPVADFYYHKAVNGENVAEGTFVYADRDVTVTGSDEETIYNVSLKKGWNIIYDVWNDNGKDEVTTKEVSGMKWYHEDDVPE